MFSNSEKAGNSYGIFPVKIVIQFYHYLMCQNLPPNADPDYATKVFDSTKRRTCYYRDILRQ